MCSDATIPEGRGRVGFAEADPRLSSFLPLHPVPPPCAPPRHEAHAPEGLGGFLYFLYLKQLSVKTELARRRGLTGVSTPSPESLGLPRTPLPHVPRPRAAGVEGSGTYFGCSG